MSCRRLRTVVLTFWFRDQIFSVPTSTFIVRLWPLNATASQLTRFAYSTGLQHQESAALLFPAIRLPKQKCHSRAPLPARPGLGIRRSPWEYSRHRRQGLECFGWPSCLPAGTDRRPDGTKDNKALVASAESVRNVHSLVCHWCKGILFVENRSASCMIDGQSAPVPLLDRAPIFTFSSFRILSKASKWHTVRLFQRADASSQCFQRAEISMDIRRRRTISRRTRRQPRWKPWRIWR